MYEQSLDFNACRRLLFAAECRIDTFKNLFCNHSKRIESLGKNLAYWLNRTVNKSTYTNKDCRKIPWSKITWFLLILTGRLRFFSHITLLFRVTVNKTILSKCNIFIRAIKAKESARCAANLASIHTTGVHTGHRHEQYHPLPDNCQTVLQSTQEECSLYSPACEMRQQEYRWTGPQ